MSQLQENKITPLSDIFQNLAPWFDAKSWSAKTSRLYWVTPRLCTDLFMLPSPWTTHTPFEFEAMKYNVLIFLATNMRSVAHSLVMFLLGDQKTMEMNWQFRTSPWISVETNNLIHSAKHLETAWWIKVCLSIENYRLDVLCWPKLQFKRGKGT